MSDEASSIPVVQFEDSAFDERFWSEGLLQHEGVDYRFWGPVSKDFWLWEAFEKLHATEKATFIAFRLAPEHKDLTVAFALVLGDRYSDGLRIQSLAAGVVNGGAEAA